MWWCVRNISQVELHPAILRTMTGNAPRSRARLEINTDTSCRVLIRQKAQAHVVLICTPMTPYGCPSSGAGMTSRRRVQFDQGTDPPDLKPMIRKPRSHAPVIPYSIFCIGVAALHLGPVG